MRFWIIVGLLLGGFSEAGEPKEVAPPPLVVVSTAGLSTESTVLILDGVRTRELGRVEHLPDAGVRAVVGPGAVLVATDVGPDRSYVASLFRVEAGRPATFLVAGLAHASRPLVAGDGSVWVSRGVAGPETDARRVDHLSVETLDWSGGPTRVRLRSDGWEAHLAALTGNEAVVYLKDAAGAEIMVLGSDGKSRLVRDVARTARDFTVDGDERLVFADVTSGIFRLGLDNGRLERLSSVTQQIAPFAVADVVFYSGGHEGLATDRGPVRPAGPGVDVVRAVSLDGKWLALWHYGKGAVEPSVVVMPVPGSVNGGKPIVYPAPPGTRLEIAGFWR